MFAQASSRLTAFSYIGALLAEPGDRKSCWQLAERAGHATPRRMQAPLAEYVWDWKAALAALQRFIVAQLGDPEAIVVLDETAELKKGTATVIWSPYFGVFAVAAAGVLCAFSAWWTHYLDSVSAAGPVQTALSLLLLELSGYCVNAIQLHVNAADLLVRRGIDRDDSR